MSALQHCGDADVQETDVLVGRGKKYSDHVGTITFKALVEANLPAYMDVATKSCDKTSLILETMEPIFKQGGRFLKETEKNSGVWVEASRKEAHSMVQRSFHDASVASQKRERSRDRVLAKAKFRAHFGSTDSTLNDIVSRKSREDPGVKQVLKASLETKRFKSAKRRRRERERDEVLPSSEKSETLPTLAPCEADSSSLPDAPTRVLVVSPEPGHVPICTGSCDEPTTALRFTAPIAADFEADNRSNTDLLQTIQKVISIAEPLYPAPREEHFGDDEQELDEFICSQLAALVEEMLDFDGDGVDDFLLVSAV